jgi:single-stranded DNA-binding protein
MIDALIQGRICGKPAERQSGNGNPYVTVKVRTSTRDGEAHFVNVIAFAEEARAALSALGDGDSIAVSGELTPKVWTDKEGNVRPSLDLLAHAVLTPYHVTRKRQATEAA